MMTPNKVWDPKEKPPDPPSKSDMKKKNSDIVSDQNAKKRLMNESPENKTPARRRDQFRKVSKSIIETEMESSKDDKINNERQKSEKKEEKEKEANNITTKRRRK